MSGNVCQVSRGHGDTDRTQEDPVVDGCAMYACNKGRRVDGVSKGYVSLVSKMSDGGKLWSKRMQTV
jgi:hypothetical protein